MLPPGHIAAGYVTTKALLHYTHAQLTHHQQTVLLWWGSVLGLAPDFDVFYWLVKHRTLKAEHKTDNHRYFLSHAPILWLLAGGLIFLLAPTEYGKLFGLLVWLCSWSHFVLDSIQYGIMWLWPLNKRIYCLFPIIQEDRFQDTLVASRNQNFFRYWFTWLLAYSRALSISLACEAIICLITVVILIKY